MFKPGCLRYSSTGKQRVGPRAAGSEHQGPDGGSGRAPRVAHPGSGDGAQEARRGAVGPSSGETGPDGTHGAHGVYPGATEGDGPALLRAGCSPDPQQVFCCYLILFVLANTSAEILFLYEFFPFKQLLLTLSWDSQPKIAPKKFKVY